MTVSGERARWARLAVGFAFWASAAFGAVAETLPALYDVVGAASEARATPETRAEPVGTLSPETGPVEVVALDATGAWAQVNLGERAAWAPIEALEPRGDAWAAGALPESLRCFGTEPFWSARLSGGDLVVSRPPEAEVALGLEAAPAATGRLGAERALLAGGEGLRAILVVAPAACSDGMSDRAFGLSGRLVLEAAGGPALLSGCCSIAP